MILNNKKTFITLEKKLINFCKKAPILLSIKVGDEFVNIKNEITKEIKSFKIDYFISEEKNIENIKFFLLKNWYPILKDERITKTALSKEEIKNLINEGFPIERALTLNKTIKQTTLWRIEKISLKKNEFIIRNLTTYDSFLYKMKMPLIIFLKQFRENKISEIEAFNIFKEKSTLIYPITSDYLKEEFINGNNQ